VKKPKNLILLVLFVAANFLSAALLFLLEPMIGKALLPWFGGSPAVWNTCMAFYQAMLLAGYAYAHWSVKHLGLQVQPIVHGVLAILPLALLPIALPAWVGQGSGDMPIMQVLTVLAVSIGAPFFVLSTSGPLLQRWFAATTHPQAGQPYFLYAAGNLGSFMALLTYPFVVEPGLSLGDQLRWWSAAYVALCVIILVCAGLLYRYRRTETAPIHDNAHPAVPPVTPAQRRRWVFLAFLPSSLMLGVTTHITTDVAAVPLLWIVPLALYLLTFVVTFGVSRPGRLAERLSPWAAAGLFGALTLAILPLKLPVGFVALFFLGAFTLIALVAHGRLSADRPNPVNLTEFYLWVAVGGALGGVFNSFVAPTIFNDNYEFFIGLALAIPVLVGLRRLYRPSTQVIALALAPILAFGLLVLIHVVLGGNGYILTGATLGVALSVCYFLYRDRPAAYGISMFPLVGMAVMALAAQPSILTERTFYSAFKVQDTGSQRILRHGLTNHGAQNLDPRRAMQPTSYYHSKGPLSNTLDLCRRLTDCQSIGIMGLGAGALAAYGREGDRITFYEIDPAIARLAQDTRYFTFLDRSPADIKTVVQDGRLGLAATKDRYDLLVMDAFTSDAIPAHLLTGEAIDTYLRKLSDNGLLLVHISNRQLNLEPIMKAAARSRGLTAKIRRDPGNDTPDHLSSTWVVMSPDASDLSSLSREWKPLRGPDVRPWTDDYSNILDALR
jgi:hypothetical protein